MTTSLYDPRTRDYLDPAAARAERDRTFQICADCRLCIKYCFSFKSLFALVDAAQEQMGPEADHHDATLRLTDADHDRIVAECFQCKLCYVNCPYTLEHPEAEWKIDFPRLMLRSLAIRQRDGKVPASAKLLARTDLQGKVATSLAPVVNAASSNRLARSLMEKTAGIAKVRMLPTYARVRFSKWFRRRSAAPVRESAVRGAVAVFPTCLVEYQEPAIGKALVGVYEHNGIGCSLPEGQVCCGMPWLDAGDVDKFAEHARRNVAALATAVREGRDVVVPQPTCAYVLKKEYPDFLGTDDARLVAEHTFDASEYLMNEHREAPLDKEFAGRTYESIVWHAACHYRAQQIGPKSKQLMELTGAKVTMIERCSAIDGTWGLRAENVEMAKKIAEPLIERVSESDAQLVTGDCHLANTSIHEGSGKVPVHPLQVLARAYGIEDDR
ncbi:MAG: heterodisulfide reductase-related iron-sulfur binding cluster [Acidimicrobiia bacterium]